MAPRRAGLGRDGGAVADVVGSVLMVGITVIMASVLGLLLLSFKGPTPLVHSSLAVSLDPGQNGWGTGDESVRITHNGGDALKASLSRLIITVGSTTTTYTGTSQLGSAWADGTLKVGETWQRTFTISSGQPVGVVVVGSQDGNSPAVLVNNALVASATSATQPCATDTAPPTVILWTQNPNTITGSTSGPITITAQLTDGCWGVNPNTVPDLFWRITPATTYTDQGAMTSVGTNTWQGTIPGQNWLNQVGYTLQYHVGPLTDLGGNTGNSPDQSSIIQANCNSDNNPPTVQSISQAPADLKSTTSASPLVVTAVVQDDCAGVDLATNPHFLYRFNNNGNNPNYTDAGPMSRITGTTWRGSTPSENWILLTGQTVDYYVGGMRDSNGNVGNSATYHDTVEAVATYTYVASNTPTTGTVSAFPSAQSSTDGGAWATVAEGGTAGAQVTVTFNANGVASSTGWITPSSAFASDNLYATYATDTPSSSNDLKLNLQDPVVTTGTITSVILHAEVSQTSNNNDGFKLYACLSGGLCDALSPLGGQSASDVTMNYDISSLRPGGGSWSWADITNLQGVVDLVQQGSRDGIWQVDRVWVDVTSSTITYSTDVRMDFTGVPAGTYQTLELQYWVTGDTFTVQVWNGAAYVNHGVALTASGSTYWSTALSAPEYNGGAPRFKIIDVNPTGTVQGNVLLDYVRMSTI
jgi:FlaG/FlaF family flagellin (archaellin)